MYYIRKQDDDDTARSYTDFTQSDTHMKQMLSTKSHGKNTKKLLLLNGYGVAAFGSTNFSCHRKTHICVQTLRAPELHKHMRGYFMKEDLNTILTHEEKQKQKQVHSIRRLQRIACFRGMRTQARDKKHKHTVK